MKVFITGAHGYIGKNLVEGLRNKYKLITPTKKELDLRDTEEVDLFFKSNPVDIVIHTAIAGGSRISEQERNALKDNNRMFFNIVRNKKNFKRMIHMGSGAEYDTSRPLIKAKENQFDERIPSDDYGFHKYICAKFIENVDYIMSFRIFGLFGKYEDYTLRFISNAICKNLLGLPITMQQNVYFEYVYIDDFVKIVEYFINHKPKHKFYNLGRGGKIDLLTIAKKINEITDKPSKIIVKKKGLKREYSCDSTRLRKELKNFEFSTFDTSLRELYLWYKQNKKSLMEREFLSDKK